MINSRQFLILVLLLKLVFVNHANAETSRLKGCLIQLKRIFSKTDSGGSVIKAPQKPSFDLLDPKIKKTKVELVDKGPEGQVVSTGKMDRIQPDASTAWGRVAKRLSKKGTEMVVFPRRFGPKGAFVDVRVKGVAGNENGVIILNPKGKGALQLRALLGHEAYHARMLAKRNAGKKDLFNSQFYSKTDSGGIYDQYISSEEIHAWSKEFSQVAVTAHHGKTVAEIQRQLKELPASLNREDKLNQIRISSKSVMSSDFDGFLRDYRQVLDAHQGFVGQIHHHLESGTFKLTFDEKSRAILETEGFIFKPDNYSKLANGSADLFAIQQEVLRLRQVDHQLQIQISLVESLVQSGKGKGYFTASEYLKLKSELSKFGSIVTQPIQ